ncbi:CoA ester lyase [Paraburkholderia phytofirmans]|uniref:HpcH/HpaI aldolase/citrate lyase family protein n=1 Tax=Paraburkholderia phytofirmans TaxID=261302 RepID=UPI0038B802F7
MTEHGAGKHRSYLFVPVNRPDRFDSAMKSGTDAMIIDVEDAVAPMDKISARNLVTAWAREDRVVYVRVNARGTPWFEEDAVLNSLPGVAGLVLPKAECSADVAALVRAASQQTAVFPLIESAKGMCNALEIAKAPHVRQLMIGTLDFMLDMQIDVDNEELNGFRAELTKISRVAGIDTPIDGVTVALHDELQLERDARNGKRFGFFGKLCIHPKQVAKVNQCYAPSGKDIAWARRVLDAAHDANGAALMIDGSMVDRPVVLRAERIMKLASTN